MGTNTPVDLNGMEVWANVVERDGCIRLRLALDDWERIDLYRGQLVPVRVLGRDDALLYLVEVAEQPPVVWITMVPRVRRNYTVRGRD